MMPGPALCRRFSLAISCVRAGDRNADGTELTAQEIVTGSFRNVAGIVNSVDANCRNDERSGFVEQEAGADTSHSGIAASPAAA